MGKWLSGEKAPALRDVYHPRLVTAFEQLASTDSTKMRTALDEKRPLTPVLHAAITAALGNFARDCVPDIVETYRGELVYAGAMMSSHFCPHARPCSVSLTYVTHTLAVAGRSTMRRFPEAGKCKRNAC